MILFEVFLIGLGIGIVVILLISAYEPFEEHE